MNVALRRPMTVDEFLVWERQQELRYEFDGWQPIPMNGGTIAHTTIAFNVSRFLDDHLPDPCRVLNGDMQVRRLSRIRYPDVIVTCTPVKNTDLAVEAPVLLVEVLSDSTAIIDQTSKSGEYTEFSSLQHYLMFEQDKPEAVLLTRGADGWTEQTIVGLEAQIPLLAFGIAIPMSAVYRRVLPGSA